MEYKKTIILLALVVFLLSIAGVSASEIGDTIASENANTIELSADNDIEDNLQTSEENEALASTDYDGAIAQTDTEVLGADSAKYSDLATEISRPGNITLTHKNYTYDKDAPEIFITEANKVIDGNGAVIDMNGSTIRAFTVTASGVTIKNLTIINANYDGDGGAIFFSISATSGTVSNCNFADNKATGDYSYGGAVYFQSTGTVTNCNFVNNSATGEGSCGGAIRMYYGTVSNCNFTDNTATGDGGAIVFDGKGTVSNCNFTNNTATMYGGAVCFYDSGTVSNCNFTNNTASRDGGAVWILFGTVSNCNFTNNTASGDGGAVYFSHDGEVTNCSFTDSAASNNGGAVYVSGIGTLKNCSFVDNKVTGANSRGGAVYFSNTGEVTNCNFTDNSASASGGAVYFSSNGDVTNCNFTNNAAIYDGGAVYFSSDGEVTNCSFTDSAASNNGGAVYVSGIGTLKNCSFVDNKAFGAYSHGGAVYFSNTGEVTNCNFTDNTATMYGGAVYFEKSGNVTNCNFTNNTAYNGGAVFFYSTSATKTVSNSRFLNNRANAEALEITKNDNNITITFTGRNNLLNAIYSPDEVTFTNVTYWGADGIATVSATMSGSNKATGQNITVGVVVNGKVVLNEVKVTDDNGMIVLPIIAGENYYISARHDTDSYYTEAKTTISNNTKFNVNVTSQTTNNKTVNITAKSNIPQDVVQGKLLFILPNGTQINATYGANGTWWAEHTFDAYGEYKVNATYVGLDNVTVNNATITVNKIKTELSGNAITTTYNINKDLIITLKDSNGNPVSGAKLIVDLNGAKTYTTDKNGQVKVSTKEIAPKAYTAKVTFNGNTNYDKSTKDIKVTVKKATPKLTAKKKTFKTTTKTKKYTITLKDNTGKAIKKAKVTLKVKGKTYKATTNSKGKATFKITNLNKKGTFKATITYKGNKYYNKVSKKANIKVIVTFKTVSKGSKDKATVKEIQRALKNKGYYLTYQGHYLKVDGKFSSCTFRSVKEFQHDNGLKVTGKVDEKTAKKLGLI